MGGVFLLVLESLGNKATYSWVVFGTSEKREVFDNLLLSIDVSFFLCTNLRSTSMNLMGSTWPH